MQGRLMVVAMVVAVLIGAAAAPAQARPLKILATGDSMMLLTDRWLKRTLSEGNVASVNSDVHVATGLTKPGLDWAAVARTQAKTNPDVVVATMGANEGYPIRGATCCGKRWVARYATRAARLMRTWRRGWRTKVYWLTLPAPNDAEMSRLFDAVNAAVIAAAARTGAMIVDLRPVITPTGGYQPRMAIGGAEQQIRSDDGVHLWWPGARLASDAIISRMRADGVLV